MSLESLTAWTKNKGTLLVLALLLVVLLGTPQAHAASLILSDYSSNGAGAPDVDEMDATLNFNVVGNTLTLGVTNDTPDPTIPGAFSLNINEIYFNTSENITGLSLTAIDGAPLNKWILAYDVNNIQVNGFGLYDVSLIDGVDNQPHVIQPMETVTFTMTFTGSGDEDDFIQLSTQVDGHIITSAAAKFYDGGGVSAYGAVPEPATIALLGLGALALLRKRRA